MPFTFSIANGIVIGMIIYPLLKLFTGRLKETTPLLWILAGYIYIAFYLHGTLLWTLAINNAVIPDFFI